MQLRVTGSSRAWSIEMSLTARVSLGALASHVLISGSDHSESRIDLW